MLTLQNNANLEYLKQEVNYIIEPMMMEVIKNCPQDSVSARSFPAHQPILTTLQIKFMMKYLENVFGERALRKSTKVVTFA